MNPEFIDFCSTLGADSDMIQGAGGNISIKNGDDLHIKASGLWLKDAARKNTFVTVSRKEILHRHSLRNENYSDLADAFGLRPSIETAMHALLPHTFVAHVHCVECLALSAHCDAKQIFESILATFQHAIIPPVRPGLPLALAVEDAIAHQSVNVFVLMNHGLIVCGDTLEEVKQTLGAVRQSLALPMRPAMPAGTELVSLNDLGWDIPQSVFIQTVAMDQETLKLVRQAPLYPDHVVFLGPIIPVAAEGAPLSAAVERFEQDNGFRPQWMIFPSQGVLAAPQSGDGELAMLDVLGRVGQRLRTSFEPLQVLPASIICDLTRWEAEAYRKKIRA
ncbi:class II aldolase [Desulfovibrio sp. UIB00]|uniref:class II aldolase/adducin family protein n=1 Tax=Desulfovibrio sp. UIB00 TaxID=2804314 RepID=UPI001F0F8796|nr:class II aldolase [Desulfovibrio sp. UIB00]